MFLCLGWARGASVSRGTSVLLCQGGVLSASASELPCLLLSPGGASVSRRGPERLCDLAGPSVLPCLGGVLGALSDLHL